MSRSFDWCVKRVLPLEGGYSNDPSDPGGATQLGITQTTLDRARRYLPELPVGVHDLKQPDALAIYELLYWRPIRGDELPLGLALICFDACVNQGERDASRFLQQAVGADVDGRIGPKTVEAALLTEPRKAIIEVAARRMFDYMQLDNLQGRFGLGWSRRLCSVLAEALGAPRIA